MCMFVWMYYMCKCVQVCECICVYVCVLQLSMNKITASIIASYSLLNGYHCNTITLQCYLTAALFNAIIIYAFIIMWCHFIVTLEHSNYELLVVVPYKVTG